MGIKNLFKKYPSTEIVETVTDTQKMAPAQQQDVTPAQQQEVTTAQQQDVTPAQPRPDHSPEYLQMRDQYYASLQDPVNVELSKFLREAKKALCLREVEGRVASNWFYYNVKLSERTLVNLHIYDYFDKGYYEAAIDSIIDDTNLRQRRIAPYSIAGLEVQRILKQTYRDLGAKGAKDVFERYQYHMRLKAAAIEVQKIRKLMDIVQSKVR